MKLKGSGRSRYNLLAWSGLFIGLLVLKASLAHAVTIDFEEVVNSTSNEPRTTLMSQGFTFTGSFRIIDDASDLVDNGTQYLAVAGPLFGAPLIMTESGGGTFSLVSLDAAKLLLEDGGEFFRNATTLEVFGTRSGEEPVTTSFSLPGGPDDPDSSVRFGTFTFGSEFTNLISVTFSGNSNFSWATDNINIVAGAAPAPETSTSVLLVTALAGLGLFAKLSRIARRKCLEMADGGSRVL